MESQYTLYIQNGSIVLIKDEPPSPAAAGIFLVFLLTSGLCLNAALLLGLSAWPPQRGATVARLLLLHLSCACALDCLLDMTSSLAVLLILHLGVPVGGEGSVAAFCRANAMLSQYIVIVEAVAVAGLAVERAVALRRLERDDKFAETSRTWRMFLVVWGYPAVLVLPLGLTSGVVGVRPFADRYSCGMVLRASDGVLYPGLLTLLGGVLPWTATMVAVGFMACRVARVHRRRRRLEAAAVQRGSTRAVPAVGQQPWQEARFTVLAVLIAAGYFVLAAPGAGSASSPPSRTSVVVVGAGGGGDLDAVHTGTHDAVFCWTRYLFPSAAAVAALALVKEARKRCELFFCQRANSNAVAQLDEALSVRPVEAAGAAGAARYCRPAHYRTPVLFSTSEGLHLRIVRDRGRGAASSEPGFACEFCDMAIAAATAPGARAPPRGGRRAPLFGPEPVAERDLEISSAADSPPTATLRPTWADDGGGRVSDSAEERRARHAARKVVRFAQTFSEIPLPAAESTQRRIKDNYWQGLS